MLELIAIAAGIILYVVPAILCLVLYTVRTIGEIINGDDYLTYGDLLGRLVASVVPIVNIGALCLDIIPEDVLERFLLKTVNRRIND